MHLVKVKCLTKKTNTKTLKNTYNIFKNRPITFYLRYNIELKINLVFGSMKEDEDVWTETLNQTV